MHQRSLHPPVGLIDSSCPCTECTDVDDSLATTLVGYVLALVHLLAALAWTRVVDRPLPRVPSCPMRAAHLWRVRRERRWLTAALFAGPFVAWGAAELAVRAVDGVTRALGAEVGPPLLTLPHLATASTLITIALIGRALFRERRDIALRLPSAFVASLAFCVWSAWLASDLVELRADVAVPIGATIVGWRVEPERAGAIDPWLERRVGRRLLTRESGDAPAFGISPCDYDAVAVSYRDDGEELERFYGCTKLCGSSMSVQWIAQAAGTEESRCTDPHVVERVLMSLGSPLAMGAFLADL